jgi:DNA mismatch repair protein mutS
MKRNEVDRTKISPMMKQYLEIKDDYLDAIVFYRLGDFYEMFFEDALIGSKELELALTGRDASLEERVPMCGVPAKAYSVYVEKLVDKGYKVAICEQLEDPKTTKGMVKRGVIQVVTKGTILDNFIDSKTSNYIANIYAFSYCYGISYTDITTGYFYAFIIDKDVEKTILKENIKEVIVTSNTSKEIVNNLRNNNVLVTISDDIDTNKEYSYLYKDLEDERLKITSQHLLSYLEYVKKGDLKHLQKIISLKSNNFLEFDDNTVRNLELIKTLRTKERRNSLLGFIDKTETAMGSRTLEYNLLHPLRDKEKILKRYDKVEKLLTEFIISSELKETLNNIYDLERIVSRISYGNLSGKDLLQLKNSIYYLKDLKRIVKDLNFDYEIDTLDDLYNLLESSINEDIPIILNEGNLIKSGYSKELDSLREIKNNSKKYILELEKQEKEKTGIKTLKISYNKVFGYYIEITKASLKDVKLEGYIRKQTLFNSERFITEELKEKEDIILNASLKINALEYELFTEVKEKVKTYLQIIQKNAKNIAEIDMLLSFSIISSNHSLVRPKINEENIVDIEAGRHLIVESVTSNYVDNSIKMKEDTSILLITGPNMAGKSTYMRELALIVIMAQMGCFVPAKSANIMLFDKIFTRIGASDDLISGDSTFMIEMKEASFALSSATKNSLILFDELGRGTATYDGMSLAQAMLEYIHNEIGCKTLFSTHYHELTNLAKDLKHLKNVHVKAIVEDKTIIFLHKIENGSVDKSYGVNVAHLAGVNKEIVDRASEILKSYEKKKNTKEIIQDSFVFEEEKETNKKLETLKEMDLNAMTPLEALNFLYELKKDMEG